MGRNGARFYQIDLVMDLNTGKAKILISKSLEKLAGQPVVVDIPEDKKELAEWLESTVFSKQRIFIGMYRNENSFTGIRKINF